MVKPRVWKSEYRIARHWFDPWMGLNRFGQRASFMDWEDAVYWAMH